jgi:chromate reductase
MKTGEHDADTVTRKSSKQPGRVNVLSLCGSLRKGSYTRMALDAAIALAPPEVDFHFFDIASLPHFNSDLTATDAAFAPVARFYDAIKAANAFLLATPEYNFSIPGPLKNAIDWSSRPPLWLARGMPVAIIGSSGGKYGAARGTMHLRQACFALDMLVIGKPEILISEAHTKYDEERKLTDEFTRGLMRELMLKLYQQAAARRDGALPLS